jgi:uncharacterized membrane protein YccC
MLEEAERVRASLAALAAGGQAASADAQTIRSFVGQVSVVLRLIADALANPRGKRAASADAVDVGVGGLAVPAGGTQRLAGEALLGQLRAITLNLSWLGDIPAAALAGQRARRRFAPRPGSGNWQLTTLRANLNLASETGRHALRLAAIAGIGEILVQATGIREGSWVPLTIFLVLRPDYSSTVDRGAQRAAGTLLGGGLGVAAAQLGHLGPCGLIAAAGLAMAVAYAMFAVNYLIYSVFLTTFVVVIGDIAGHPAAPTAIARLVATAIGSVLAVGAYVAWPTWEGLTAQEKFSRLFEAHSDYVGALLQSLGSPNPDLPRLRRLQAGARVARSEAEASAARLEDEPQHPPLTSAMARSVIAPVNRLASAELALHALVVSPSQPDQALVDGGYDRPADERVTALADALAQAMRELAVSLTTLAIDTLESDLRQRLSTNCGEPFPAGSKRIQRSSRWRSSWWRDLTPSLRNALRRW